MEAVHALINTTVLTFAISGMVMFLFENIAALLRDALAEI